MNKKVQKEKANPEFDFRTIETFEDACKKECIDPNQLSGAPGIPEEFVKPLVAAYKIMVIYKAINNGWTPDWSDSSQYKYFPWYAVLSSGFGFSRSAYDCVGSGTCVGSRLCTNTSEKALYIAEQFKNEYREFFLYPEK